MATQAEIDAALGLPPAAMSQDELDAALGADARPWWERAASHIAQGLTLGTADELGAVIDAAIWGDDDEGLWNNIVSAWQTRQGELQADREADPWLSRLLPLLSGMGASFGVAKKGADVLESAVASAKGGAVYGAAAQEEGGLEDRLTGALTGGLTGGLAGGAFRAAGGRLEAPAPTPARDPSLSVRRAEDMVKARFAEADGSLGKAGDEALAAVRKSWTLPYLLNRDTDRGLRFVQDMQSSPAAARRIQQDVGEFLRTMRRIEQDDFDRVLKQARVETPRRALETYKEFAEELATGTGDLKRVGDMAEEIRRQVFRASTDPEAVANMLAQRQGLSKGGRYAYDTLARIAALAKPTLKPGSRITHYKAALRPFRDWGKDYADGPQTGYQAAVDAARGAGPGGQTGTVRNLLTRGWELGRVSGFGQHQARSGFYGAIDDLSADERALTKLLEQGGIGGQARYRTVPGLIGGGIGAMTAGFPGFVTGGSLGALVGGLPARARTGGLRWLSDPRRWRATGPGPKEPGRRFQGSLSRWLATGDLEEE